MARRLLAIEWATTLQPAHAGVTLKFEETIIYDPNRDEAQNRLQDLLVQALPGQGMKRLTRYSHPRPTKEKVITLGLLFRQTGEGPWPRIWKTN